MPRCHARAPVRGRSTRSRVQLVPTASRRFDHGDGELRPGGSATRTSGGGPRCRCATRSRNYRFLIGQVRRAHRWLTAARAYRPRRARRHRLPAGRRTRRRRPGRGDAIVYQIFPDRFARSAARRPAARCRTGPSVRLGRPGRRPRPGDARASSTAATSTASPSTWTTSRSLGADTVYLTPIFPARSNHRYDAATFDRVDPLLGGDAALPGSPTRLHARGMRLVGDITTNHTGDAHEWFTDPDSRDCTTSTPTAGTSPGAACQPAEAQLGLGRSCAGGSSAPRTRCCGAGWTDVRLDGWRVDVANMTGRRGADDRTHEVSRLMREAVARGPPRRAAGRRARPRRRRRPRPRTAGTGTMNYAGFTRPVWTWLRSPTTWTCPTSSGYPAGCRRR